MELQNLNVSSYLAPKPIIAAQTQDSISDTCKNVWRQLLLYLLLDSRMINNAFIPNLLKAAFGSTLFFTLSGILIRATHIQLCSSHFRVLFRLVLGFELSIVKYVLTILLSIPDIRSLQAAGMQFSTK